MGNHGPKSGRNATEGEGRGRGAVVQKPRGVQEEDRGTDSYGVYHLNRWDSIGSG